MENVSDTAVIPSLQKDLKSKISIIVSTVDIPDLRFFSDDIFTQQPVRVLVTGLELY